MQVSMILAVAATVAEGKLFVLGGGWNITNGKLPSALALLIEVDWDETNRRHDVELTLVDGDGRPVIFNGPAGPKPLVVQTHFEVGRPAGIPPGSSLNQTLAVSVPMLSLAAGQIHEWRCAINGKQLAHRTFLVR